MATPTKPPCFPDDPDYLDGYSKVIELKIPVPPNTIPTEYCGTIYECGGKFQMYCCEVPAPVVGFEPLEERQFFKSPLEDE